MTVGTTEARISHNGNGTTGPFTIPMYFIENSHILVIKTERATNAETVLVESVDYTLSGAGNPLGGTLTLTSSMSSLFTITIIRDPDSLQSISYPEFDKFPSASHERGLDKLTMICARLRDLINRTIRLSDGAINTNAQLPAPLGGNVLVWAPDGKSLQNAPAQIGTTLIDLAVSTGSVLVGWVQAGVGAILRTVFDKLRERVSFEDYGAIGNGISDDLAAINLAITRSPGKVIEGEPNKVYRITAPVVVATSFTKLDFRWSTLKLDDPSGLLSHIKIGHQAWRVNANTVTRCIFTRQQVATAGAAVDANLVGVLEVSDCRIYGDNKIWNGIQLYRVISAVVDSKMHIDNCINMGIRGEGTDLSTNSCNDIHIECRWIEGGDYGIFAYDFCQGWYIDKAVCFDQDVANIALLASAAGNAGNSFKIRSTDMDTCAGNGLYVEHHDAVQVNSSWVSNHSGTGIVIKPTSTNVIIEGNQVYPAGTADGIEVGGDGGLITSNLVAGGGKNVVVKSTATDTLIEGNLFHGGQYGVYTVENPADCTIISNRFSGHSSAPMSDAVTPNSRHISGNSGDTSVGVTSFITVGASPFTYTAGGRPEMISIFAGTVSNITVGGNSVGFSTERVIVLPPGKSVVVTYSSVPFMLKQFL